MKIKLDENMPARLAVLLTGMGHQVDTVAEEGLTGQPDSVVWQASNREDRFLITQDLDFSDTRLLRPGTHAGLLLVRLRQPSAHALLLHVARAFTDNPVESWRGSFVVLTEHKLRVKSH